MAEKVLEIEFTNLKDVLGSYLAAQEESRKAREDEIQKLAQRLERVARQEAPKGRTGALRRSIKSEVRHSQDGSRVRLRADAPYAKFVIHGTRPHIILPRVAKVLRFEVADRIVFAKRVHHPGTQPNPFGERALQAAEPDFRDTMKAILKRIERRFGK